MNEEKDQFEVKRFKTRGLNQLETRTSSKDPKHCKIDALKQQSSLEKSRARAQSCECYIQF